MLEAGKTNFEPPKISNPKEFLAKPFQGLEVRELSDPPDMEFLKWLPIIKDEAGLVLQDQKWYIVKASEIGIPRRLLPHASDVLIHSHPFSEEDRHHEEAIPSIRDFLNCSPTAKNLIVSSFGITRYYTVKDGNRRVLEAESFSFSPRFTDRENHPAYLKFLKVNGAKYELHPWNKITDGKLGELLRP